MDHDADAITSLKPRQIQLKHEQPKSWFPFVHKPIGPYSKLDEAKVFQTHLKNFNFRGLKVNFVNVLEKEYKYFVHHTVEVGKNKEQLPNGKTDGERSAYMMDAHVSIPPWDIELSRAQNSKAAISIGRKLEHGNAVLQGQVMHAPELGSMSHWGLDVDYTYKDMNFELKMNTQPTLTCTYSQPITETLGMGTMIEFSPASDKAKLNYIGKYNDKFSQAVVSVNAGDSSKAMSLSNDLSLAKKSPMSSERDWVSVLHLGYLANFRMNGVEVKGLCDSSGNVNCVLSLPVIEQVQANMQLSGNINLLTNNYEFGVLFQVMQ